jgi:NADPH:quinone reductase-like Zn-dependent oxidoreductase
MRRYELQAFGLENLRLVQAQSPPLSPNQVRIRVRAISLNYRDLAVIEGSYNKKLALPCVPISDAAGEVTEIGAHVSKFVVGQRVVTQFISQWQDGRYEGRFLKSTLGSPGPGVAAEEIVLEQEALVALPDLYSFEQGCTLPIAALTAYSALVVEGKLKKKETMVTLGTGGVSLFAVQIAKALGAHAIVTSRSRDKLIAALELGADLGIDTTQDPDWANAVIDFCDGAGAHVCVETVGIATFNDSVRATRAGGTLALLGSLSGLRGEVNLSPIFMKRLTVAGILVDHRSHFEEMLAFFSKHRIKPVIHSVYPFEELPEALAALARGEHLGKIVVCNPGPSAENTKSISPAEARVSQPPS